MKENKFILNENNFIFLNKTDKTFPAINEKIYKNINKLITEEYGVAKEVEDEVEFIKRFILDNIRYNRPSEEYDNLNIYRNAMAIQCFHKEFLLHYEVYDCVNEEEYKKFDKSILSCQINPRQQVLIIRTAFIKGKPTIHLDLVLKHELTHAYEYIRKGKGILMSKKYEKLYEGILQIMYQYEPYINTNTVEGLVHGLAYTLYMSFKCEQNAFFNGLDTELKDCGLNWKSVIHNTDIYKNLERIRKILNVKNKEILNYSIKQYLRMEPPLYYKLLRNAEKRILRGIGRVIVKNQKEEINNGTYTTPKNKLN